MHACNSVSKPTYFEFVYGYTLHKAYRPNSGFDSQQVQVVEVIFLVSS